MAGGGIGFLRIFLHLAFFACSPFDHLYPTGESGHDMKSFQILCIGLTLILVVLAGCAGNDPMAPSGQQKQVTGATTPTLLMEKIALAYAERNLDCYADLLAEDFVFTFLPCDVKDLGLGQDHWNREDELISAARMFSGEPHVMDDGTVVPAVIAIEVLECRQTIPWEDAGAGYGTGTLRAVYSMRVLFVRDGASDLMVDGPSIFYAEPGKDNDGNTVYRLSGWGDQSKVCP